MNSTVENDVSPNDDGMTAERERSTIQFPYMNLVDALEMAEAVHDNVGVGHCTEDQLAAWMNLSPKSSGFRVRVSTAKMFGLIESTGVGAFSLTALGRSIIDPAQSRRAKVEAFLNVPLYKLVYDSYKGGVVPPTAAFERDIRKWGVAEKQTSRARQAFERSADVAGFYESGRNRLVIPAAASFKGEDSEPKEREGGGGGNGGGQPPPPKLDPIIKGLIDRLPPSGDVWPSAERELWLTILKSSFQLVYKDSEATA
jgi:hypothetical protein